MTTVVLQSLPQICTVCEGSRRMNLLPLGWVPLNTLPIPCPHCSDPTSLRVAVQVIAGRAP